MATASDEHPDRAEHEPDSERAALDAGAFAGLLDLVEDFLVDGFRRPRAAGPESEGRAGRAPGEAPAGAARLAGGPPRPAPSAPSSAKPSSVSPAASAPPDSLAEVAREVAACRLCDLHRQRRHAVPGEGVERPAVLVVGEGPGADEDRTGRPFVGPAGQYLDKWLQAVGLSRERNCFITNIVKCRPPANRDPLPEESSACFPYLQRQIRLLAPRAILCVGRISSRLLLGRESPISSLRGSVHEVGGIPLVATYHPSAVLRNPDLRRPVWEDLKRLRSALGPGGPAGIPD